VTDVAAARGFAGTFRGYQLHALAAVDADRASDSPRSCVVLPPGAGKTVVGLEAARRAGRRTLVLVPNTAVLGQWADTWDGMFPTVDGGPAPPCGTDRSLGSSLTVLTYQSLAVIDGDTTAAQRRRVVIGGDTESLLGLLHPHGRELVARAADLGPWTLVLDECHHLLATWGALVHALVAVLGTDTVVLGLTATPAAQLAGCQRVLHDELFGRVDVEVSAPALVKEGDLAPYQELVVFTEPTVEEDTWLVSERTRFADLQLELVAGRLGTIPLVVWLQRRAGQRATKVGVAVSWGSFEAAEPALALAVLRMAHAGLLPVPEGARLREQHRVPPGAEDWVAVLTDFCVGHLQPSGDPTDAAALKAIRGVLPGLGYQLTRRGVRATTSPVDRVCALSESKLAGAVQALATERELLGHGLRALVLCDFEVQAARLPSGLRDTPLSVRSGSARALLATLAEADVGGRGGLRPVLVTGRSFACGRALAEELVAFCARAGHPVRSEVFDTDPALVAVGGDGAALSIRRSVRLATDFFAAGGAGVLVGTRALLGEGWDCAAVNVTIDLTTAATSTAVTQMRGRGLRLDPQWPGKVADNWSVCCISREHPRGDADYARLVRKHAAHFAPGPDGVVESGVGHCDPVLSPYGPPTQDEAAGVTARSVARAADRAGARTRWGIGQPYAGAETASVRVRSVQTMGAVPTSLPGAALAPRPLTPRLTARAPVVLLTTLAGVVVPGAVAGASAGAAVGTATGAGVAVAAGAALGVVSGVRGARMVDAPSALERLAWAVADGLQASGGAARGADAVVLATTVEGWVRCELGGVALQESTRFAEALDELLAPLTEPRYLVGRKVFDPPAGWWRRLRCAGRATLGLSFGSAVVWHTVPGWFSRNAQRRANLASAWEHHLGPTRFLDAASAEGAAVLELFRGEDPFSLVTQLRTTWS